MIERRRKREEINLAKKVRAMTVNRKVRRGRPKNSREWTIRKDLEKLSIRGELCRDKREWHLVTSTPVAAHCGERAGR